MYISDKRMLELKDLLKATSVIRYDREFCEAIGILPQNLYQIENPEKVNRVQHFTAQHIQNAGKAFGADMNFIFGFSPEPFLLQRNPKSGRSTKRSTSSRIINPKTEK